MALFSLLVLGGMPIERLPAPFALLLVAIFGGITAGLVRRSRVAGAFAVPAPFGNVAQYVRDALAADAPQPAELLVLAALFATSLFVLRGVGGIWALRPAGNA